MLVQRLVVGAEEFSKEIDAQLGIPGEVCWSHFSTWSRFVIGAIDTIPGGGGTVEGPGIMVQGFWFRV